MNLDLGGISNRTLSVRLGAWPRIIRAAHRTTPASAGFGSSRFSSPTHAFRVLYAAEKFPIAFSEAVIRDKFQGKSRKYLFKPHLEERFVTEIGSLAPLSLLDFRDPAANELGVDTDAKGARSHQRGQEFAEALHDQTTVDGLIFNSRLTGGNCVAIFDRAFGTLTATTAQELMRLAEFWTEIDRRGIIIRRARGL